MKEEVNSREIKLRWGQNKLKAETESHQVKQIFNKTLQMTRIKSREPPI